LETLIAESKAVIEDRLAFLQSSQKFHDAIVRLAGNRTLALVAGALNELWSVQQLERGGTVDGEHSIERRNAAVHDHEGIVDAIRRGDEAETAKRLQTHLYVAQKMVMADEAVSSPVVVADPRNLAWSELRQTSKRGPTSRNM
jgi:DNA-binding FadR family transcriptional regulator